MNEADPHFREMIALTDKMNQRQIEAAARTEERHFAEADKQREFLLRVLQMTGNAAKEAVKPVGPSCDELQIVPAGRRQDATVVDLPVAQAMRSSEEIKVGDMESMRIMVDGFIHHNRQLKFMDPNEDGRFLTGYVRDPAAEDAPNIYSHTANVKGYLDVQAKPAFKADGRLHSLYIMDAKSVDEADRKAEPRKG